MSRHIRLSLITLLVCLVLMALPDTAHAQLIPIDPVDDVGREVRLAIDELQYNLLRLHAQIQWFLMKIVVMTGLIIDLITEFLADNAFAPLITQTNNQFGVAVSMSFTIAMLVLGCSYMIAHFVRLNVVDFRSAFMWFLAAGLFFQTGPQLYANMNTLRANINSFFYATALDAMSNPGDSVKSILQV